MAKGESEIKQYFEEQMPKRIKQAARLANYDLYYGPIDLETRRAENLPRKMTFTQAVDIVRDWTSEHVTDIYYDNDIGQVLGDKEPEAYEDEDTGEIFEPSWESIYRYDRRDVLRILFGAELAPYVR